MMSESGVIVIGGGPAGLTAAYLLAKRGIPVVVLEQDSRYLGGISRTEEYKGFRFDIGGHRFFSKAREVEALWDELLPDDMLERPRSSRIFYGGKFYSYPLKPLEALRNLGVLQSILCGFSYMKAQALPVRNPRTFEDWVSNQFGTRLFRIFFKTYTEKVWGMSCKEISADWAAQRIKGLSLGRAVLHGLMPKPKGGNRKNVVKTLIDTFRYPRLGPGMMWEVAGRRIEELGGSIQMGRRVTGLEFHAATGEWTVTARSADGAEEDYRGAHVVSSAAIRDLVEGLQPVPPQPVVHAAGSLRYRDFLTVALIARDRGVFDDNWIYIHDPSVSVGRIQNYKSWSPELVPDPQLCCYGLEYFCTEGDGLWERSDADLIALARREVAKLGLAEGEDVIDGCVVRQRKAYPVYDGDYARHVDVVRRALARDYPGLHLVGRNGMHKYNNQDHSMLTAMFALENMQGASHDVWAVNTDFEYHEEQRIVPPEGTTLPDTERARVSAGA